MTAPSSLRKTIETYACSFYNKPSTEHEDPHWMDTADPASIQTFEQLGNNTRYNPQCKPELYDYLVQSGVYTWIQRNPNFQDIIQGLEFITPHLTTATTILDAGSGDGVMACWYAQQFPQAHITCFDASRELLQCARTHQKNLRLPYPRFLRANIYAHQAQNDSLPFPNNTFDAVTATKFLHEFQTMYGNPPRGTYCDLHLERTVPPLLRVLKTGGILIGTLAQTSCLSRVVPDLEQACSDAGAVHCETELVPEKDGLVGAGLILFKITK